MMLALATNLASHQFPPGRKCCWPIGETRDPGFRFCEQHVQTPGPYCDDCIRENKPYREIGEYR